MNNNKNYHFKINQISNPLQPINSRHNNNTQNNFKMGNNFHDTKRYDSNTNNRNNTFNQGMKKTVSKNYFEENNRGKKNVNDNMNYLRDNNKQQMLNNNNYIKNNNNGAGNFENPYQSPNFNVTKNKFLMNFNIPNLINTQDRVINFGQDKSENNFKKTLRKGTSNLIQNSSFNIINNNPNLNNNTFNNSLRGTNSSPFPQNTGRDFGKKSNNSIEKNAHNTVGYLGNNNNPHGYNNGTVNFKNYSDSSSSNIYSTNSNSKEDNCYNYFEKNASSVREISYKEDPNHKFRGAMEDVGKWVDKFINNPDVGLYAIFDGHGGADIARYLKNRIPEVLAKSLSPLKNRFETDDLNYDIENSLNRVFHQVDEEINLMPESEYMGSTAVMVLICKEKDKFSPLSSRKVIYCANVGDSRCVLISSFGVKRLSYDHKASDPVEINRVNSTGGMIFNGRVFGQLIITRAFGDSSLKKYGVSSSPHISKNYISDKDKYLILASDGVWDVIEDEELLKLSQSVSNSDELSKLIIKTSLIRGSQDNVSCITLKL